MIGEFEQNRIGGSGWPSGPLLADHLYEAVDIMSRLTGMMDCVALWYVGRKQARVVVGDK